MGSTSLIPDNASLFQCHGTVVETIYQLMLMRHHEDGGTGLIDLIQKLHDLVGKLRIDIAGRLIGNEQVGVIHQRAGQGHTLLLAAGEFRRIVLVLIIQPQQIQNIGHPPADKPPRHTGHLQGKCHIIKDRHGGDKPEILEHYTDGATKVRDLPLLHMDKVPAIYRHLALGGHFLPQQRFDEGAFAGTGMPHHKDEFAFFDM